MKKVVVIMAGGKGKRLWPISKEELPKQFLPLTHKDSMLELTIKRAMKIVNPEEIYIVTQPEYVEITKKQMLGIPTDNLLTGPYLKSTTEAIAFSTAAIKQKYGDAIMVILPSDHLIEEDKKLVTVIETATQLAEEDHIVTIGITPEYPETNYGYIEKGDLQEKEGVYKVKQFKEKPDYAVAESYFEDKRHLWNSGIFIWKTSLIEQEFSTYLPTVYEKMNQLLLLWQNGENQKKIGEIFIGVETKSFDYEILEKSSNIYVIEGNFYWVDIGNFRTLKKVKRKDKDHNIIEGRVLTQDSKNNMILSKDKLIVAIGVENLIIVETEKEILIMNAENQTDCSNPILIETIKKK